VMLILDEFTNEEGHAMRLLELFLSAKLLEWGQA
jgi:hypothetical protein